MTKYVPSKRGSYSASCGPCGGLIMFDWQNWQHKPKSSHFGFLLKKVPEWSDPEVSGSHDKSWSDSPNAEESHFSPAAYGALSKQIVNPTTIHRLRQLNTRDETDRTGGILGKSPWTNWFWTSCGENEDPPSTVDLRGDEEGGEVMVIFLTRGKSSPPASFQIITLHFLLKVWRWVASSMLLSNC